MFEIKNGVGTISEIQKDFLEDILETAAKTRETINITDKAGKPIHYEVRIFSF